MNKFLNLKKRNLNNLTENVLLIQVLTVAFFLNKSKKKIVVAESCTGGLLSSYLTQLAGSSLWFEHGIVSYSNKSKIKFLNVSSFDLNEKGAVSKEIAIEMVKGLSFNENKKIISVSVTGIAGPIGEMSNKTKGLVYFGINGSNGVQVENQIFIGNRAKIRNSSVFWALRIITNYLALIIKS